MRPRFPYALTRPFLFGLDAERAHELTLDAIARAAGHAAACLWCAAAHRRPGRSSPACAFPTASGLAAGLDKNGRCIDGFGAMGFGFVEVGTVTPQGAARQPEAAHVPPAAGQCTDQPARLQQRRARGLHRQRAGARAASAPAAACSGLNIGKNAATPIERAVDDYLLGLDGVFPHADYVTVNISSPNTKNLRSLQSDAALDALLSALVQRRDALARAARPHACRCS